MASWFREPPSQISIMLMPVPIVFHLLRRELRIIITENSTKKKVSISWSFLRLTQDRANRTIERLQSQSTITVAVRDHPQPPQNQIIEGTSTCISRRSHPYLAQLANPHRNTAQTKSARTPNIRHILNKGKTKERASQGIEDIRSQAAKPLKKNRNIIIRSLQSKRSNHLLKVHQARPLLLNHQSLTSIEAKARIEDRNLTKSNQANKFPKTKSRSWSNERNFAHTFLRQILQWCSF